MRSRVKGKVAFISVLPVAVADPRDIANALLFLAADEARSSPASLLPSTSGQP